MSSGQKLMLFPSRTACAISFLRQLEIIKNGIYDYHIQGGRAIKAAFNEGFVDLASNADALGKEADKAKASKVAPVRSAFRTEGNEFIEAVRIATAYVNLIEKGQSSSQTLTGRFNS